MAITHADLIDWVDESQPKSTKEVEFRIIAGRAYYAAYHAVNDSYEADESQFHDVGAHARLINTLKNSKSKDERLLGFRLQACKDIRTEADYKLDKNFTRHRCVSAITASKRVIELLS